jgi:hypothetical protein
VSNKSNGSIASGATSHPHNLKVVGSNPTPQPPFTLISKRIFREAFHPQATYHQAWQPIGNRTGGDRELSDMAQLALQCPHCRAEKIGFAPRGAVPQYAQVSQTAFCFYNAKGAAKPSLPSCKMMPLA